MSLPVKHATCGLCDEHGSAMEAAAGELERDSVLKELALCGGFSRADRQTYLCLFA